MALQEADIVSAGIDERRPHQQWGEGLSPTHLVFWVVDGTLGYAGGTGRILANADDILTVPASCPKWLFTETAALRGLWMHVADTTRWASLRAPLPSIRPAQSLDILKPLAEQMRQESVRHDADGAEACRLLSLMFLHYVQRELQHDIPQAQHIITERLSALWLTIKADLGRNWTMAEMASLLHTSEGHYHRLMKTHYGCSPMQMLRRWRLERAAELLLSSSRTLDHVAGEVGYSSPYAFSKAFCEHFGCRPGAYRNRSDEVSIRNGVSTCHSKR